MKLKKKTIRLIYLYIVSMIALIFVLSPIVLMLSTALTSREDILTKKIAIIPRNPTLEGFVRLFEIAGFSKYILNSLFVSSMSTLISLSLASLGAYSLSRFNYPGRKSISKLILTIYMFPPILIVIPLFILMNRYRLTDTHLSLIFAYTTLTLPFSVWVLKGFFDNLPEDLEDAAKLDGCSNLGILIRIMLPLSAPALMAIGAFCFVLAWCDLLFALTFIHSTELHTLAVGIQNLVGRMWFDYALIMSAATVMILPAVIIFWLIQKYIVTGLSAGALKG